MVDALQDFIPPASFDQVTQLLIHDNLVVKIKRERKTRHGDYRRLPNGTHQITINSNLNIYRFLITLIHEIAHFEAYKTYGKMIKPHGLEWKSVFQHLMLPFIRPEVFPNDVLPLLAMHFKNPKASSDSDPVLALKLKQYDAPNGKTFIFEVPEGATFRLYNGKMFRKGPKRRTRFECTELSSGRLYVFNPNAEVELIEKV
jgi:SprT protein